MKIGWLVRQYLVFLSLHKQLQHWKGFQILDFFQEPHCMSIFYPKLVQHSSTELVVRGPHIDQNSFLITVPLPLGLRWNPTSLWYKTYSKKSRNVCLIKCKTSILLQTLFSKRLNIFSVLRSLQIRQVCR